jgi:methionyl aminopeptidase
VERLAKSLKNVTVSEKAAGAEKPANGSVASPDDSEQDGGDDEKADGAGKKKRRPRKKKKKAKARPQTSPPTIPVSELYRDGAYPTGQEVPYVNENAYRTTSEEKRHVERQSENETFMREYRQAAVVHRQVRQWARKELIKPGESIMNIAEGIENAVRKLTGHMGLEEGDCIKGGVGFPTGLSRNHCAAHHTPNAGNKGVLDKDDVLKVDIGVHINGRIVDSAFTWTENPRYDNLIKAVREATNRGVKVRSLSFL